MSAVDILRQLVEFRTYEPDGMRGCADFLSKELSRVGLSVTVDKLNNVYGTKEFTAGDSAFLIEVDLDKVTPTANWTKNPLCLSEEGDRLYGLDVSNKAPIATVLHVLEDLRQCRFKKLELLFTPPRRVTEESGIEYFLAHNRLEARIGINLTGTVQGGRFMVSLGCGGVVRFAVTTIGKQAATIEPTWRTLGHNAIYDMVKVIEALRMLPSARMKIDDYDAWAELSVSMIHGGTAWGSIVPSECEITCSRLVLPNEDWDEVKKEIENTLHTLRDIEFKVSYGPPVRPYLIDRANPAPTLIVDSVQRALGYTPKFNIQAGITDCAELDQLGGVKTVTLGPGDPFLAINPDEYVSAKRIEEFTRIIRYMLTDNTH
jgi:acetylornithine deacetylase/succinyl-diaminopimelate desuccinylase-like protein